MSSVRGSQCLHRAELFPPSSGPAGGHQGSSACKLEKQALLTNVMLISFLSVQPINSYSKHSSYLSQWWPGEVYVLTD